MDGRARYSSHCIGGSDVLSVLHGGPGADEPTGQFFFAPVRPRAHQPYLDQRKTKNVAAAAVLMGANLAGAGFNARARGQPIRRHRARILPSADRWSRDADDGLFGATASSWRAHQSASAYR